jgi:hypothetical protein
MKLKNMWPDLVLPPINLWTAPRLSFYAGVTRALPSRRVTRAKQDPQRVIRALTEAR